MFPNSSFRFLKFINIAHCTHTRYLATETSAQNLLVNVLGMKEDVAKRFIAKNNINQVETRKLNDTVQFIKTQKYKINDILKYPKIFNPKGNRTWNHYYDYFKECGCVDVPITNILNFRRIRYSPISMLKEEGIIPTDAKIAENLNNQLDLPLPDEMIEDLKDDSLTLSFVHRAITHRYLIVRLGAEDEDLEKISRLHSYIYNKSLKTFCENVNLALDLGFSPGKILRNAYILQTNPKTTRDTLCELPVFLNCDLCKQMKLYPKLIGVSVQQIKTIYDLLKKYEISDETISKAMNIFTLSPETIEERLIDIKGTPETRVLMNNPATLKLIIHYHRAKNRLQFLNKVRLKCASLVVIGFDGDVFDNYIKEGKDVNKRKEASNFLQALLDCTKDDVDVNFKCHPFYLYVPFVDIEHTYKYLRTQRFENDHIVKAISILLYPQEKIAEVLETIRSDHYLSTRKPRANKAQILNLALYYLEKDHHFTGNGIWRVNDDYVQAS